MRTRIGLLGTMTLLLAAACGDASTSDRGGAELPPRAGSERGTSADGEGSGADSTMTETNPQQEEEETLPGQPVTMVDVDKDGIADEKDCDATNPAIGLRLVDDPLAADATLFQPATGFPSTSWAFADQAYRQTRLVDGGDASFFMGDSAVSDVDIEVRAASTEISNGITPTLRQMFVLVGANMDADGKFTAWGCGAEVVQGMSPTQRTSVVKLSGMPGAITTTAIQRTARTVLGVGEDYAIKAHVEGGKITCSVMQGTDLSTLTTAEATNQGEIKGSLGFYTRQTKAYFKNVKACKVQAAVSAPK